MPETPDRGEDGFEVDRHIDDQPERDDLLEPADIDPAPVDEPTMDAATGVLPDPEERPETQGSDPMVAERVTEDAKEGPRLADEEAEDGQIAEEEPWDPTAPGIAEELGPIEPTETP